LPGAGGVVDTAIEALAGAEQCDDGGEDHDPAEEVMDGEEHLRSR
jgi:hypothetical protein